MDHINKEVEPLLIMYNRVKDRISKRDEMLPNNGGE